jgi:transposase
MKKVSRELPKMEAGCAKPEMTVGLDMGDRYSHYCLLNADRQVVEEGHMQSTEAALRRHFEAEPCLRIALECGTHSPWVSRLLIQLGHQVIVANARKIPAITGSESKNDRNRGPQRRVFAAGVERCREAGALRGLVKSAGGRLPSCSSESLPGRAAMFIPSALASAATPLVEQIALLNAQIEGMDKQVEKLAAKYPEIGLLRTVPGVGPIVAVARKLAVLLHSMWRSGQRFQPFPQAAAVAA